MADFEVGDDVNLSFSLEYLIGEIRKSRTSLITFYKGGFSVDYLDGLTVDEFIQEVYIANKTAKEIEDKINKAKGKRNGKY